MSARRMEQLVGFLSWISQQFYHARPFLQHLYSIARGTKSRVHRTEQLFRQLFFWVRIFRLNRWVVPCERLVVSSVPARSDACAEPDMVGIGGWWHPNPNVSLEEVDQAEVHWFHEPVSVARLPFSHLLKPQQLTEPYRIIAALELLAILVLLVLRQATSQVVSAVVSQETDSMVCRFATKKWFSAKEPIASILQELAWLCSSSRVELHIGHVAGVSNEWADDLSRGRLARFNPSNRHRVNVHDPAFGTTVVPPSAQPGNPMPFPPWETMFRTQLQLLKAETQPPSVFQ